MKNIKALDFFVNKVAVKAGVYLTVIAIITYFGMIYSKFETVSLVPGTVSFSLPPSMIKAPFDFKIISSNLHSDLNVKTGDLLINVKKKIDEKIEDADLDSLYDIDESLVAKGNGLIVLHRILHEGQIVRTGEPLFYFFDDSTKLQVFINLPPAKAVDLELGTELFVQVSSSDSNTDLRIKGIVLSKMRVSGASSPQITSYIATVELEKLHEYRKFFYDGMPVQVSISEGFSSPISKFSETLYKSLSKAWING